MIFQNGRSVGSVGCVSVLFPMALYFASNSSRLRWVGSWLGFRVWVVNRVSFVTRRAESSGASCRSVRNTGWKPVAVK